jgi:hypothetical protein
MALEAYDKWQTVIFTLSKPFCKVETDQNITSECQNVAGVFNWLFFLSLLLATESYITAPSQSISDPKVPKWNYLASVQALYEKQDKTPPQHHEVKHFKCSQIINSK